MNLKCKIGKTVLDNPVIAASGTFGYGREFNEFFDINKLGGFITKTITLNPKRGNVSPRIYDLGFGILNSIGLENPGLGAFKRDYLDFLNPLKTKVFVSVYGQNLSEWSRLIASLEKERIAGFELNFSCPNIKGKIISGDKEQAYKVASYLRRFTKKTLMAKLSYSPQIKEVAGALQAAKIDAVVLINTLPAMAIDSETQRPVLGNVVGGLSGPCTRPVALRCVYETAPTLKIPVIGCGGIMNYKDVLEFLSAGARAVEIGSANLINPYACLEIVTKLKEYYEKKM